MLRYINQIKFISLAKPKDYSQICYVRVLQSVKIDIER